MSIGKNLRLNRLFNSESKRAIMIPMDHGATYGPMTGLNPKKIIQMAASIKPSVQSVVLHRGAASHSSEFLSLSQLPWILHLSASTSLSQDPSRKVLVAQVDDAIKMGAEAVSVHVNLGVPSEAAMIKDLGLISTQCSFWGMPLLVMMYSTLTGQSSASSLVSSLKQSARLAAELGADIVKINYPGSMDAMAEITSGCFSPILIAGGDFNGDDSMIIKQVECAIKGNAAGVCMGRNIFQHSNPAEFLRNLASIVHSNAVKSSIN